MKLKHRKKWRPSKTWHTPRGVFVTLFHQKISPDKFKALNDEDKYCFLLLGHVHNEINWLQRMALIVTQYHRDGNNLEASGRMMQAMLVSRLFLAKLYEFSVVLSDQKVLRRFVSEYFDPKDKAKGEKQLVELDRLFETNAWIQTARNAHFLHYPKLGQVKETINDPEILWEPEVAHGRHRSNTFYPTSDVLANYSWFRLADTNEPMNGLAKALDTLNEISRITLDAIEQSIGYFIDAKLQKLEDSTQVTVFVPSSLSDIELNFFVGMRRPRTAE